MDPNYLYPNYTPFPHLLSAPSTTSTSSPYATPFSTPYTTPTLPTLTAPTTGPSTPDASATPIDTYECHLFPPPQPQLLPSIPSISPPDPLSTGLSDSTTLSKQSPIKLSPLFPVADTMASSASPSSTSPPPTSANIHHQSHPHLFPEQISPGGNPESSRSATTNTGVTAASENVAYRPPSSTSSHAASYQAGPGISGGPALQATHPSADIYRHRSASPWVSQHHQQQPHQQNQQHQSPLNPSTDYPDSSNAYNASTSHALSMFNNPQHTYGGSHSHYSLNQSHYPLNVSHTSMEYSFPPANPTTTAHYGSTTMQHDPYHSPDQQRAILPYGYPIQSQIYHHPHHTGTSSLLDKHLTSDLRSSGSYGISNSLSHYGASLNNSNKFAERYTSSLKTEQQTNMTSRTARTAGTIKSATRPIRTATSGSNNTSNNSKRSTSIEQQGVNDKTADCTTTGISTSGGTIITPSGPNGSTSINHGIVDESNTTLWDLKDGQEGPRGKPPYPYLTLIRIALLSCEAKKMTLQELYDALEERYPFFRGDQKGWKNSIRHNLSLNKCFKKASRHILDPGKGSYWYCDPTEEYSTPRIRVKSEDGTAKLRGGSKSKKRKAESSLASGDAEGSDTFQQQQREVGEYTFPHLSNNSYFNNNNGEGRGNYFFDDTKSIKIKVGDLKLPFNFSSSSTSSSGGVGNSIGPNKRQRAISAPSPITPNFFDNMANYAGLTGLTGGNDQDDEHSSAAVAPFGMTGATTSHGSNLQPQHIPPIFQQSSQVTKYEFPASTFYQRGDEVSSGYHHLNTHPHRLPLPSLLSDIGPHSGGSDSTFPLETPRTIYTRSSANNEGKAQVRPASIGLERGIKEEPRSSSDPFNKFGSSGANAVTGEKELGEATEGGNGGGEKTEEVMPGPATAYVFPLTQKTYNDPGQTKRVFVNPSGSITTAMTMSITGTTTKVANVSPSPSNSPLQSYRQLGGVQGSIQTNKTNINQAIEIFNSNLLQDSLTTTTSSTAQAISSTSSNPFTVPNNPRSIEEDRNRPAPLYINDKQGKNFFSPPSATSPSRQLPTEFDTLFSSAPFGMLFDGPSSVTSPRKGSFFSGLAAR